MEGKMLEQRDLELIGQIVNKEVQVVREDLTRVEETLSNRIDNLEQSFTKLEQSQTKLVQSQTEIVQSQTELEQSFTKLEQSQTKLEQSQTEIVQSQTKLEHSQTKLEQSHVNLEQSLKATEYLLMDEIGKTQDYLEKKFEREFEKYKLDNNKEHNLIMSYYLSVRSEQSTIDSIEKSVFDLYNRVEKLEELTS
jgi:septal ring factor EnvC (AmiA/AmiB activator)